MEDENDPWSQFPDADEWDQFPDAETPVSEATPSGLEHDETGVAATLPTPTPNMFADMADEDARLVYEAYSRHPDSQVDQETGDIIYRGTPVPRSEGNSFVADAFGTLGEIIGAPAQAAATVVDTAFGTNLQESAKNLNRGAGGGLLDVGKNIVTGGLAFADRFTRLPGVSEEELRGGQAEQGVLGDASVWIDENAPEFNPEGTAQSFGKIGTEVGAGIVLGNKAQAVLKAAGVSTPVIKALDSKLVKVGKYLAKTLTSALSGSVGTMATVDGSNDTAVVGRNPQFEKPQEVLPILKGLQNTDPGTAARIVEDRINVLFDSMVIALPGEWIADGGKQAVKLANSWIFRPVGSAVSANVRANLVMDSLMESVSNVVDPEGINPEKAAFWQDKVIKILRDPANSKLLLGISKEGVSDVDITLDTASTIRRGLSGIDPAAAGNELFDPNDAEALGRHFSEISKGVIDETGSAGQTAIAMDRPTAETDRLLQEGSEAFGGGEAIEDSRENLQQIGEGKVAKAVAGTPTSIDQRKLATQSEQFSKEIAEQSDFGSRLDEARDEGYSDINVERDRLTKEILGAEEKGSAALKSQSDELFGTISDKAKPRASFEENLAAAADYMTPKMQKIMREAGASIAEDGEVILPENVKKLQRLREPLREEIRRLRKERLEEEADLLQNVLDDISDTKGSVGKTALKSFIKHEEDVLAPTTRQGLPKELADIREANRTDLPKKADLSEAALRSTISGDKANTVSHLADTLSRAEYGESHGKIAEFIYADAVEQLRDQVKGTDLSELDAKPIFATLKKYRQALTNPKFKGVLDKFDELEKMITQHKTDKKSLETILKTKIGDPTVMKDEIYNGILGDFFTAHGIREPNGYESFRRLFLNKQTTGPRETGRLDKLITLAERENPVILDGMKAAYLKHFRDVALSSNNVRKEIIPQIAEEILDENSHIVNIGNKLFKEGSDQEFFKAVRVVLGSALDSTRAKKAGSYKLESVGEAAKETRAAVSQIVRLVYGPLSRTGTRIGALTQGLLDLKKPREKALSMVDAMMKDPAGFMAAYDKSLKAWGKRDGREMRDVVKWLIQSGVYNTSDEKGLQATLKKINEEEQTKEVFDK